MWAAIWYDWRGPRGLSGLPTLIPSSCPEMSYKPFSRGPLVNGAGRSNEGSHHCIIIPRYQLRLGSRKRVGGIGEDLKRFGAEATAQEGRSLPMEPVARPEPEDTTPGSVEAC